MSKKFLLEIWIESVLVCCTELVNNYELLNFKRIFASRVEACHVTDKLYGCKYMLTYCVKETLVIN